ncbi:transcription factor TFIIIC complex subunit Tfc6 [Aspergillus heteromorphus CBS 117.55]|uniref:Transcription factor TFIIIC complex subunit Tfc6 n=1 Tax=Aspergillus heteromorphus CBS 117.55 TaxID=1448321 RepID=A0A317X4I6_9EURO|nr:transcription factor TFIIIC complex subunit Tfc6 [Aspergillus heteromorphus CBS 117.55]PWY92512.1 transcription factor TFIIIC complex subunit Tfc6 [Aspergillus heteromorphus CBS 117.55]
MPPRPRRSNRAPGARTKYIDDPFEAAGVLSDEDEDPSVVATRKKGKGKAKQPVYDDTSDEDFNMGNGNEDEEEEDDDEYQDNDVEMVEDDNDAGEEDEEEGDDDDDDAASVSQANEAPRRRRKPAATSTPRVPKQRRPDGTIALAGDETHSRGSWNPLEHVGKAVHLRVTFGTDDRDLFSVLSARDQWCRGLDSTFPTRATLDEAPSVNDYGYGRSFGLESDELPRESTRGWDWYYDEDLGARFRKSQRMKKIKEKDARRVYFPRPRGEHTVLVGPLEGQKVFSLGRHDVVDFGEAWGEVPSKPVKQESKGKAGSGGERKKKKREGWILNLGQKIQCLAWVPNQGGLTQYLSAVAPILPDQKEEYPDPLKDQAAPAFRPSAPYPCVLQLWAFKAQEAESLTRTIDMTFKPRLRLAVCTEWGDLRRMAWCPMPRAPRDEDDEGAQKNVGLLAGIWGDGRVRVIDIKLGRDPKQTEFYKLQSPVFEAKAPSTVCTCLTWLSPSDLAVGCANGFVAIWSILPSQASPSNPLPYFYQQLHSTWVLSIASAYPTNPHIICTTSMDGDTRLTSIVDPHKDMVNTNRMRVGSAHLTYSPMLHCFISSDENDFARLLAVRRFFTSTAIARLPSMISAVGPCSSWHPSVLFGCTEGTVQATSPLRRMLHAKEKQWQQTWFQHEWVRGPDANSSGTSRFHDGHRAESTSLLRNLVGDPKLVNGAAVITVFEEGTHVTALSWNPNQSCAGWAAAGMGCGLVRVEDLALS